jgi:DNA-binding NtrC family response regulator
MAMNHDAKSKDDELERMKAEFLAKGGAVTQGKTKAMASELGISNNTWNNKLTKAEKDAKDGK